MMAAIKTQNQTRFRGRTPSGWNRRMAENCAVTGFLRSSVSRTVGIQDSKKIDPPYNTGARDWKYNNDYVDSSDQYRHSKWLSFMEKRLKLAKKLLNQRTGVLIVTIDEHEVHHLRTLLEEIFNGFYIQMVTYVSNPTGATQGRFSRIEEYAIYCFAPEAYVDSNGDPMIGENNESKEVRWKSLLRSGTSARREDRKNMFYPVYVDAQKGIVVDAGEPLPFEEEPSFSPVNGLEVAWPIRTDGSYGRWSVGAETFRKLIKQGYVQLGRFDNARKTYGITYISSQTQKMIENGDVVITGRNPETGVEGTIKTVAAIGIENMRTKHVADYAGFTEATMYRRFSSKEILLREAFLYIDKKISSILTQSSYIRKPDDTPFELAIYAIWHKVFRYLIGHKEETIFLIRYRYSSLYTEEVRSKRQAYNGGFDKAYAVFEKHLGCSDCSYRGFLINYIFEMTLCFAEKIITGKIEDDKDTEERIWLAVSSAVKSWTLQQEAVIEDNQDYCFPAKGANKCLNTEQENKGNTPT